MAATEEKPDVGGTEVAAAMARVVAALPGGGEQRPGQQQMAAAVVDAIEGRRHLLVQAGTGTGKSLAYLVPALLSAKPVVVATATTCQTPMKGVPYGHAEHRRHLRPPQQGRQGRPAWCPSSGAGLPGPR